MKDTRTRVKTELLRIIGLALLLAAGGRYLTHIGGPSAALTVDVARTMYPGDYRALEDTFAGQKMPVLTAHEASTGREEMVSFDAGGVAVLIPGNTCIQQQITALKGAQVLYEAIAEDVPVRVVLLANERDEASIRYKALLLRKAVRPTFDIWYAGDTSTLTKTVLSDHLHSAFLVQNHTIRSVFRADDHSGIIREISDLRPAS